LKTRLIAAPTFWQLRAIAELAVCGYELFANLLSFPGARGQITVLARIIVTDPCGRPTY
jgi:hypothetical protein